MSAFIELQSEYFSDNAFAMFWQNLRNLGASEVRVNLTTETATLEGVINNWNESLVSRMGVKLNAYQTMIVWDTFSLSSTDDQYEDFVNDEAESIIKDAQRAKPDDMNVLSYSIDGVSII